MYGGSRRSLFSDRSPGVPSPAGEARAETASVRPPDLSSPPCQWDDWHPITDIGDVGAHPEVFWSEPTVDPDALA